MKYFTVLGVLVLAVSVSALGQTIDPNIGFCNVTGTACGGGDPNTIQNATSFQMWSFGANDANSPWYMLIAVPLTSGSTTAPTISGTGFSVSQIGSADFFSSSSGSIYDLFSQTSSLGGNSSMNASNLFGSAEQNAFGSTPGLFEVFLYEVTPGFNGNTAYTFTSSGLSAGTFIAAIGVGGNNNNIQFSTPFTTSGLESVPDGGMALMLLGGAMVGLETLRRYFRV
jgi:hypothetical protein